ncbi:DUF427-domain-containing protein [Xylariaceae sp. FL1272]|nr:DUF427-domain-containing protein [Xylariaceae sp. FL1272]
MPPGGPPQNLDELARSLIKKGPVKVLQVSPRRVRIQFGGRWIADTTEAQLIWEHPYYPSYYLPLAAFKDGVLEYPEDQSQAGYTLARLKVDGSSTDRVIVFEGGNSALSNLVRVEFGAVDAWFEEDSRIDVHPKDPFKRVDVVFSSRPIRVLIAGTEIANANAGALHLYETGLPTRFYLPATAVDPKFLRPSDTVTKCPYKGEANYYDVVVDGKMYKDIVWYYKTAKLECAGVAGALCFYNEKVDMELAGKLLERPESPFS